MIEKVLTNVLRKHGVFKKVSHNPVPYLNRSPQNRQPFHKKFSRFPSYYGNYLKIANAISEAKWKIFEETGKLPAVDWNVVKRD